MRRMLLGVVLLAVGMVIGVVAVAVNLPARGQGAGSGAVVNGDTNGDGTLDIADAVHLLLHMFRGGPAPAACADSPELVSRVSLLEEKVGALEGLPAELATRAAQLETLKEQFAKVGGIDAFFVSNTRAKFRRTPEFGPNAFGMVFIPPDPSEPPLTRWTLSGGTIDGERLHFRTERPGHLLIRLHARWGVGGGGDRNLSLYLDGQRARLTYSDEHLDTNHYEWAPANVPPGDHEFVLLGSFSADPATIELPFGLGDCTFTAEFAPADLTGG